MTRLIDADALKRHYAWWEDDKQELFDSIVDQQPTFEAVPVIRCRNCRYYSMNDIGFCMNKYGINDFMEADDYCSHAHGKD